MAENETSQNLGEAPGVAQRAYLHPRGESLGEPQLLVITTDSGLLGRNLLRQMNAAIEASGHAGLTKATQVIPEMRVLGNNALDS